MSNSVTLNSNIASLNAQRRLGDSTTALQESFSRLSSGLRINRASDDSAGLAISESLKVDARVFAQGVRNLNDGLSTLSIADGALEELTNIVIRLEELAEQAANGTVEKEQREALNEEAQTLNKEYFRIVQTTEFNGRSLLVGGYDELSLQAGYGTEGGISADLGGAVGDGTFSEYFSYPVGNTPYSVDTGDFNMDGILDIVAVNFVSRTVSVRLGCGDGSFYPSDSLSTGSSPHDVCVGDFNNDGILDLVTADSGSSTISVYSGQGDGTFSSRVSYATGSQPYSVTTGDFDGDGSLDIVTSDAIGDTASVFINKGDGTFNEASAFSAGNYPYYIATADFNGDGVEDLITADWLDNTASVLLGQGDGTFSSATAISVGSRPAWVGTADFNGDDIADFVTANYVDGTVSVALGVGDGTFSDIAAYQAGAAMYGATLGDFNGDGSMDLAVASTSKNSVQILLNNGDGTFSTGTTVAAGGFPQSVTAGDVNGDGVLDLISAAKGDNRVNVLIGNVTSGVAPILPFSLSTLVDARQALPLFQRKLEQLASQRGEIGAFQARVSVASNTLSVARENYITAESQITDADIAEESAQLVRNSILQEAGIAILAQANQSPELALRLLGDI